MQRLVAEFESSGLGQNEFCRKEGLALSTSRRQMKKRHLDKCETPHGGGLPRVELAPNRHTSIRYKGIETVESQSFSETIDRWAEDSCYRRPAAHAA